jgi:hypothetical protein
MNWPSWRHFADLRASFGSDPGEFLSQPVQVSPKFRQEVASGCETASVLSNSSTAEMSAPGFAFATTLRILYLLAASTISVVP